jgi:hypothetical protein
MKNELKIIRSRITRQIRSKRSPVTTKWHVNASQNKKLRSNQGTVIFPKTKQRERMKTKKTTKRTSENNGNNRGNKFAT